jgi:hypothetical protein
MPTGPQERSAEGQLVEVLDFIASHGLDPVRRRDIRRAFIVGGEDRHKTRKRSRA